MSRKDISVCKVESKFVIMLSVALKESEDGGNDCGSGSSEKGSGSLKGHLNHGSSVFGN